MIVADVAVAADVHVGHKIVALAAGIESSGGCVQLLGAAVSTHGVVVIGDACILDVGLAVTISADDAKTVVSDGALYLVALSLSNFHSSFEGFTENSNPVTVHCSVWCKKPKRLAFRSVANTEAQFATVVSGAREEVDWEAGATNWQVNAATANVWAVDTEYIRSTSATERHHVDQEDGRLEPEGPELEFQNTRKRHGARFDGEKVVSFGLRGEKEILE